MSTNGIYPLDIYAMPISHLRSKARHLIRGLSELGSRFAPTLKSVARHVGEITRQVAPRLLEHAGRSLLDEFIPPSTGGLGYIIDADPTTANPTFGYIPPRPSYPNIIQSELGPAMQAYREEFPSMGRIPKPIDIPIHQGPQAYGRSGFQTQSEVVPLASAAALVPKKKKSKSKKKSKKPAPSKKSKKPAPPKKSKSKSKKRAKKIDYVTVV